MSDLEAIAHDLNHAMRPSVPIPLRAPTRVRWGGGEGGVTAETTAPARAVAAPAKSDKPAPTRRDLSRIVEVNVAGGGITIAMTPRGRFTPAQQAARHAEADALLAEALTHVPEGTHVRVALRGRVIASTNPADVVSIRPHQPKK